MFIINQPYIMNPEETKLIMEFCDDRLKRMKDPCKGCRYKANRNTKNQFCIFVNAPACWELDSNT